MIAGADKPKQSKVVAFGAAAGEDDFIAIAAKHGCHVASRLLDRSAALAAMLMNRRSVAEVLEQPRSHGLEYRRIETRGGVGVHVNALHAGCIQFIGNGGSSDL